LTKVFERCARAIAVNDGKEVRRDASRPLEQCGLALDDVARGVDHELGVDRRREDGGGDSSESELHR